MEWYLILKLIEGSLTPVHGGFIFQDDDRLAGTVHITHGWLCTGCTDFIFICNKHKVHCFMVCCRGINFVLSALAFNIIPTVFEVGLVTGILVCACHLVAPDIFSVFIYPMLPMHFTFCIMNAVWYLSLLALRISLTRYSLPVVEHPYQR